MERPDRVRKTKKNKKTAPVRLLVGNSPQVLVRRKIITTFRKAECDSLDNYEVRGGNEIRTPPLPHTPPIMPSLTHSFTPSLLPSFFLPFTF